MRKLTFPIEWFLNEMLKQNKRGTIHNNLVHTTLILINLLL